LAVVWLWLRASRSLAALVATVLVFAALLYTFGLKSPDVGTALLQSIAGATLRAGDNKLVTASGQALMLAIRLLGPLFFGLTLVSLRGRIQR
jgi:hypothetical protein